jgi:V-type H+-transporting ATPase subunit d
MYGFEALSANMDDGFVEALLRSLRKGLLDDNVYSQLKVTSNIQEFKLVLEDTDYTSDIFSNQDNDSEFEVTMLRKAMKEKLMAELEFLQGQAVYPLSQFMTMMLHGYQIDNVVFMIEGLKSNRPREELMRIADPLGRFPELKNIMPIDGEDYASLYQNVLIDLPIGVYFRKFLDEVTSSAQTDETVEIDTKFISEAMADYSLLQIQMRVKKIWMNEFYDFCQRETNSGAGAMMADLLKFESDLQTI